MLRMERKTVLHIVEMILLAGNDQFSVDVQKKITGFCFLSFGCVRQGRKPPVGSGNNFKTPLSLQMPETSHLFKFFF